MQNLDFAVIKKLGYTKGRIVCFLLLLLNHQVFQPFVHDIGMALATFVQII